MNRLSEQIKNLDKIGNNETKPKVNPVAEAREQNELYREERQGNEDKHKHRVFVISIYVLWGLAVLVLVVRLVHFILPWEFHWLAEVQVQSLDKFLFSGSIGGILGKYGFNVFFKK